LDFYNLDELFPKIWPADDDYNPNDPTPSTEKPVSSSSSPPPQIRKSLQELNENSNPVQGEEDGSDPLGIKDSIIGV